MATTTNYGWTTPDDTALVKDGASAIRTLGTSVDTTTKNLNPSTTLGDLEFRSSTSNTNTRLGIGSSGQSLTVVAGVPSWAASAMSVLTTTGDSLYASAANTLARLGIGSTGQVLTVAGGLPSWAALPAAGGMVSLASGSLSGSSLALTSISGSYKNLQLVLRDINISAQAEIRTTVNSVTTYDWIALDSTSAYAQFVNNFGIANFPQTRYNMNTGDDNAPLCINIFDYANTTSHKLLDSFISNKNDRSGNPSNLVRAFGVSRDTAAITSVTVALSTGTFSAGTYILYGVS
jgi:hypothetical protein